MCSQQHLTLIPYVLANVVLLSAVYLSQMRRLYMAPMYFLGLQGVKMKEGFFNFLLFPMSSHDVNALFSSCFHNVPNDFS
jgi:hypothetical protein